MSSRMPKGRTPHRLSTTTLAVLLAAGLGPAVADAQYFEPLPRRADVVAPDAGTSLDAVLRLTSSAAAYPRGEGHRPLLVIPALFSDSPEPHVATGDMQDVLFADTGRTVTTYYDEVSAQRLYVDGHVAPWVRTDVPREEAVGNLNGQGFYGARADDHLRAAIAAADPYVDYRQFDNDGPDGVPDSGDDDGIVDGVVFANIEVAGSCGGPGFWPHFGAVRDENDDIGVATGDIGASGRPIEVQVYIADSAVGCDGELLGPSVLAHEFGHLLGMPDYYRSVTGLEPEERHWNIGCFGIMGAGAWGCGSGPPSNEFGPVHPSALAKRLVGWVEVQEVGGVTDQEYVLEPVQTSGQVLRVPLSPGGVEYFLIEYRPRIGFDDVLPDDGVLIYHVDPVFRPLGWDAPVPNYRHHLLEADGDSALRKVAAVGGNRGVAADMFGRAGAIDSVPRTGAPSTQHHGGLPATLVIHSIQVANGVARIRLSTTTPLDGQLLSAAPSNPVALSSYEARFRVSGGTPPYTVNEPDGGLPVDGLEISVANGNEIVIQGPLLDQGHLIVPVSVQDDAGEVWFANHAFQAGDAALTEEQLMEELVLRATGGSQLARYLDNAGNENGRLDVGDLRGYLERTDGTQ